MAALPDHTDREIPMFLDTDGATQAGSVVTASDPADGRRQLIRRAPEVSERVAEVRAARIDDALAAALGTDDPQRLLAVTEALDVLARHLTPEAVGRLRP